MKKSKFTGEQIAFALRQRRWARPLLSCAARWAYPKPPSYRWKQFYGGLGPSELRKMRQFEEESQKLSRRPAQPTGLCRTSASTKPCSKSCWQESLAPERRREIVHWVQNQFGVSERRGCYALRFDWRTHRYRSVRPDQAPLRQRIKPTHQGDCRGADSIQLSSDPCAAATGRLAGETQTRAPVNPEDGLNLHTKRPRRHVMAARRGRTALGTKAANLIWAMDLVPDALFNGKRFRALTVVDAYTRECLAIHADQGVKGEQFIDVMDRLLFERGSASATVRVDNGPEFISRALDHWA